MEQATHPRGRLARPSQATAAAIAAAGAAADGLIFPRGPSGSWDEGAVGNPVVRCFMGDNEERWFMWYSGRTQPSQPHDVTAPSAGVMGVAVSADGVAWERGDGVVEGLRGAGAASDVGAAMLASDDWWCFDTCHVAVSDVQILSNSSVQSGVGVYWCFYSGGDYEPVQLPAGLAGPPLAGDGAADAVTAVEGVRLRPGLAMSQDARNWARIEGDHHSGALFDVGAPGEWDHLFIGRPQVLPVAPRDMRMYYYSYDEARKRYVVGYATSPDGFRWSKRGVVFDPVAAGAGPDDFDAGGAAACSMVRDVDNRQYLMFYEAVAADGVARSVGLAVSKDGSKWKRCPTPVLTPPRAATRKGQDAWDAGAVGCPSAVSMSGGRWRLYYAGRAADVRGGAWEGIGLALSVAGSPTFEGVPIQFERRRAPATAAAAADGDQS